MNMMEGKDDAISRRAAIEALDALCDRECEYSKKQRSVMCGACHLGSAFDAVEQLPAQPPLEEFEWCTDCKEYDQKNHCCHRFTKVIRQTVEELKAQQWIPVTERLPDPDTWVLVSCDEDVTIMAVTGYGEWYFTDGDFTHGKIDAWQPPPEPWKEGQE